MKVFESEVVDEREEKIKEQRVSCLFVEGQAKYTAYWDVESKCRGPSGVWATSADANVFDRGMTAHFTCSSTSTSISSPIILKMFEKIYRFSAELSPCYLRSPQVSAGAIKWERAKRTDAASKSLTLLFLNCLQNGYH